MREKCLQQNSHTLILFYINIIEVIFFIRGIIQRMRVKALEGEIEMNVLPSQGVRS